MSPRPTPVLCSPLALLRLSQSASILPFPLWRTQLLCCPLFTPDFLFSIMQSFQLSARARRLKSLTITAGFHIGNKELIHITLPCPTAFTLNPHPPPYDELLPTQTLLRATAALPKLGTMGFVLFHRLTSLSPARPASAHSLPFSLYFFFSVHTVPASAPPAQTNTAQTDVNSHSNSGAAGAPHR